jgi:hypothetical protein
MPANEEHGAAESFGMAPVFASPRRATNTRVAFGTNAEDLSQREIRIPALPANAMARVATAADEARILSHADVAASLEAAVPDLEAWENTL